MLIRRYIFAGILLFCILVIISISFPATNVRSNDLKCCITSKETFVLIFVYNVGTSVAVLQPTERVAPGEDTHLFLA